MVLRNLGAGLCRSALIAVFAIFLESAPRAETPAEVKVGLIVPLSGSYARMGQVMRMGAELGVEHINAEGGVKSLGGAKLKLVVMDAGDSPEKAKNAAQRMVAQEPDLVAASGAWLSSFTLAVTEVTERAKLPVLTLSFSNSITDRGFQYVFQTSPTASAMVETSFPEITELVESSTGKLPKKVAIIADNTAASVSSMKPVREHLLKERGMELLFDETWTPPLSDATGLVQRVRASRPDLLLFLPNTPSDTKLFLEKMNEFGLGKGRIPTVTFSASVVQPDLITAMDPDLLNGLMTVVANWGFKGHEQLKAALKARYGEPWTTQEAISTYGDMFIVKEALEAAKRADREAVAAALRTMDTREGPAKYYPGRHVKFDAQGRRVDAVPLIVQWQNHEPVTVFPADIAVSAPLPFKN